LVFIGPPSTAIALMGDKTAARRAMQAAGVPVVPGIDHLLQDDEEAHQVVAAIGYPVMIKAALGGGGKGMRLVHHEQQLVEALRGARSEARSPFTIQPYINVSSTSPRCQVLADAYGRVVARELMLDQRAIRKW
jgi:acetyl-CoA carboxylase biotin carboxylase subunit